MGKRFISGGLGVIIAAGMLFSCGGSSNSKDGFFFGENGLFSMGESLPQLEVSIDMANRAAVTPYLWTKSEPVIQIDVTAVDPETGARYPVNDAICLISIQYAAKDFPYGDSRRDIRWQGSLSDPDASTSHFCFTGEAKDIIDTEPFSGKKYRVENGAWINYTKQLPAVDGRAYYQIPNPYDAKKIAEVYNENGVWKIRMNNADGSNSFRTAVRFRVKAVKEGFEDSDVKRSFESTRCADFDMSLSSRRFNAGSLYNSASVSDMPEGFRSYPVEVCERYEGWSANNGISANNYHRFGITWVGKNAAGHSILPDESINKNFDPLRKKVVVFSHGWQPSGYYQMFTYNGFSGAADYGTWKSSSTAGTGIEWTANKWIDKGYNVAIFTWNRFSQDETKYTVAVPGASERKIWYPASNKRMRFYKEGAGENPDRSKAEADCIRSASIGMMFAQEYLDALPSDYNPDLVAFAGHSLGNQVVMNGAEKLMNACIADPAKVRLSAMPDRLDLLDPYYGNEDDTDSEGRLVTDDTNGAFGWGMFCGDNVKAYADKLYSWSKISGDDIDGTSVADAKQIPVQWFRTSAVTEDWMNYNYDNWNLIFKTNYVKFRLGQKDGHNYVSPNNHYGYIPTGNTAGYVDGSAHSEAIAWYFRSIARTQDSGITSVSSLNGSTASISAATPVSVLADKIALARDSNVFSWFEQTLTQKYSYFYGYYWAAGTQTTLNTADDKFTKMTNSSSWSDWSKQGDGYMRF